MARFNFTIIINGEEIQEDMDASFSLNESINGVGKDVTLRGNYSDVIKTGDDIIMLGSDGDELLLSGTVSSVDYGRNDRREGVVVKAIDDTTKLKWITVDTFSVDVGSTSFDIIKSLLDTHDKEKLFTVASEDINDDTVFSDTVYERTNVYDIVFDIADRSSSYWYVNSVYDSNTMNVTRNIVFTKPDESAVNKLHPSIDDIGKTPDRENGSLKRESFVDSETADVPYNSVQVDGTGTDPESFENINVPDVSEFSFPRTSESDPDIENIFDGGNDITVTDSRKTGAPIDVRRFTMVASDSGEPSVPEDSVSFTMNRKIATPPSWFTDGIRPSFPIRHLVTPNARNNGVDEVAGTDAYVSGYLSEAIPTASASAFNDPDESNVLTFSRVVPRERSGVTTFEETIYRLKIFGIFSYGAIEYPDESLDNAFVRDKVSRPKQA